MKKIYLFIYYAFATHLPGSYTPVFGAICNKFRIFLVKKIFKKCGKISIIDRNVYFGNGSNIEIDDYSGIGSDCVIPNNTIIGKFVMFGPQVHIVANNHQHSDTNIPMCFQGPQCKTPPKTIIEDDCWLGVRSILTPGRHLKKGSIVAAGAVLTKDFEEYSILGGNPARIIKSRITIH